MGADIDSLPPSAKSPTTPAAALQAMAGGTRCVPPDF